MATKQRAQEWTGLSLSERDPEPPAHLSAASQALWRDVIGRCRSPGRRAMLLQALEALDRANEAAEIVRQEGLVTTTKTTGVVHCHPCARVEREFRQLFVKIWHGALAFHWHGPTDGRP